jgi:hypothetical protein
MSAIASVCDEMLQPTEKKRAKPAFLAISVDVGPGLDQVGEKALGEVLRILGPISLLAQESVEWSPVNLA